MTTRKANVKSSRLKGFYKLDRAERLQRLMDFVGNLSPEGMSVFDRPLPFELSDMLIENAIGNFPLPLGVATNFRVNGTDYIVPMAVEESSVIAASSNAARWVYESGGFESELVSGTALMIGQIQVLDLPPGRFDEIETALLTTHRERLLHVANETHPRLLMRGGGARGIEVRKFPDAAVPFLVMHVLVDTRDAMGANIVNTICERLAPEVEQITGGRVGLRILSNLADRRVFRARCRVRVDFLKTNQDDPAPLSGIQAARRVIEAYLFADSDPYRATTHNKGIMNGIDPVVLATGNDWRAVEAGAHAYASSGGRYRSLSKWSIEGDQETDAGTFLVGELCIPLQLGTVGGVTRLHPAAKLALQILGNPSSEELSKITASVGLASNLAAMRALATCGIQRGHMKLHAKNLALSAGAQGKEIDLVANELILGRKISAVTAEKALARIRAQDPAPLKPFIGE